MKVILQSTPQATMNRFDSTAYQYPYTQYINKIEGD